MLSSERRPSFVKSTFEFQYLSAAGADSWMLRLAVYKALNRGDIEAMCQNVVQMIHFLNMHKDEYGIDLTGLQEDMNETLQMKEEMATFATNLQVKLKKVSNAQASHGPIEKCYRLRAQYLSSSSATLRAPFAQIDTGYHAAAKALEYATTHLQELKNSFAELEKITSLFGVAETMGAERTEIDKQLKILEYFRHAWDLHSKLFHWADMALGHVNMHDTSFISHIKEELLEISSAKFTQLSKNCFRNDPHADFALTELHRQIHVNMAACDHPPSCSRTSPLPKCKLL